MQKDEIMDYGPESVRMQQLARNRKLTESLLMQSLAPQQGQMVSGRYVSPGILGALGSLAGVIIGSRRLDSMDKEQVDIDKQYRSGLSDAMKSFMEKSSGRPGETLNDQQAGDLLSNNVAPVLREPVAPNKTGAVMEGVASDYGPIRSLAQSMLKTQDKPALGQKDILSLSGFSPDSRLAAALAGGDISALKPEGKEHVINGQILSRLPDGSNGYKVVADARERFGPVGPVGSDGLVGQVSNQTGQVHFAPRGVSVNVDASGKPAADEFQKSLSKKRAEIIERSYDKASGSAPILASLNDATNSLDAGVKSGQFADVKLALAKIGKAFGLSDDPEIANTETYKAAVAQQVAAYVKNLGSGSGISNADLTFAQKASGSDVNLDDASLRRLIDMAKVGAVNNIMAHKDLIRKQMGASGAIPADLDAMSVDLGEFSPGENIGERNGRFFLKGPTPDTKRNPNPAMPQIKAASPSSSKVMTLEDFLSK